MAEKLTMKKLSEELEQLRTQMQELEARLENNLESRLAQVLAASKATPQPVSKAVSPAGIDTEQRQRMITQEAYLIAERRGFQEGDPSQDWIEAERLVDFRLMQSSEPKRPATSQSKPRKKTTPAAKKPVAAKKTASKTSGSVKS